MNRTNHRRKQSRANQSPHWGLFFALLFLGGVLFATGWFFFSFTQLRATANQNPEPGDHSETASSGLDEKKIAANEFRQRMLEEEAKLRAKYDQARRLHRMEEKPGQGDAYREWRKRKENSEKHLSKFKADRTDDPASVKLQLQNEISGYLEDQPPR